MERRSTDDMISRFDSKLDKLADTMSGMAGDLKVVASSLSIHIADDKEKHATLDSNVDSLMLTRAQGRGVILAVSSIGSLMGGAIALVGHKIFGQG